jgi:hypothetical protein
VVSLATSWPNAEDSAGGVRVASSQHVIQPRPPAALWPEQRLSEGQQQEGQNAQAKTAIFSAADGRRCGRLVKKKWALEL